MHPIYKTLSRELAVIETFSAVKNTLTPAIKKRILQVGLDQTKRELETFLEGRAVGISLLLMASEDILNELYESASTDK